jgi:hypothetical protein
LSFFWLLDSTLCWVLVLFSSWCIWQIEHQDIDTEPITMPSSIKLWNKIPNHIRLNSSRYCFKRFLNRNLRKKSYYFNIGSRKEQIIFACLRLKCSSLKDHLFQKILLIQVYVHLEKWKLLLITCCNVQIIYLLGMKLYKI